MHLDVIAGDTFQWEFLSKSSDFCFMATHFHDDQEQLVCRTDGVKNVEIIGAFQVEHNGSFVLMWQNHQEGFTIDRSGIKITCKVAHIRPPVQDEVVNTFTTADLSPEDELISSNSSQDNTATKNSSPGRLTDEQKCEIFRQMEYPPNPTTITTALKSGLNDEHYGLKNKSTITKLFGNKQQDHVLELSTTSSPNRAETATSCMKNTFRSLTLLPASRRVRKDFEAKVVITEKFPFQLRDFLPVIKFISTTGDQKRPQILAIWFSEYIPSTKKSEELNQRQIKYDYYRLKYWRFYTALLQENSAYGRLKEVGSWVLACKEEHDVIDMMLAIVLKARGNVLRARLRHVIDALNVDTSFETQGQDDTQGQDGKLMKQLAKTYAFYLEVLHAQQRLVHVMDDWSIVLDMHGLIFETSV
ncbi:hypothetical protein PsorP6_005149 [Peronosclerospora sorghi]|uniref:Uncharacterized protein n=1 Tax=Peronosclerospora sorghi TaxID=230839 RepID=A0ACC0W4J5_9STRA|nr:hypothetical protein PsorP6_005149 [Peronosclerospora sorghi]